MRTTDVFIIGGGPAGMAAAASAGASGLNVVLAEAAELGGRMLTHIEGGVGESMFGETMTGPEFVSHCKKMLSGMRNVKIIHSSVISVSRDREIETLGASNNVFKAGAVIIASGGKDRQFAACGIRYPSGIEGIYSASDALAAHCLYGRRIGNRAVIIGAGSDALTVARRLALEGTMVTGVIERRPFLSTSARMRQECLDDLHIPVYVSAEVMGLKGDKRVREVLVRTPQKEFSLRCDAVVCAVGRVPDASLIPYVSCDDNGIAEVDSHYMTDTAGIFIVGGALHSCGLCDCAAAEGGMAGYSAAEYARHGVISDRRGFIRKGNCIAYVLPVRATAGRYADVSIRVTETMDSGTLVFRDGSGNIVKQTEPRMLNAGKEIRLRLSSEEIGEGECLTVSAEKKQ